MNKFEELQFPAEKVETFDWAQKRIWATVRFRLGMLLQYTYGLTSLHKPQGDFTTKLLEPFKQAKENKSTVEALTNCANICKFPEVLGSSRQNPNAVNILLGIMDNDHIERQVSNIVVVNNLVTSSLVELLSIHDINMPVYCEGQGLFMNMLYETDYLSNGPLESSYCWALSCSSALRGRLRFGTGVYRINCKKLLPRRLFHGTTSNECDFDKLEFDVIYYADERGCDEHGIEKPSHPLCDIFFRTTENELVLVDITGSHLKTNVNQKKEKLSKWISVQQHKIPLQLHGVVLAPCYTGDSTTHKRVHVVCGQEARLHLGGLMQTFHWF